MIEDLIQLSIGALFGVAVMAGITWRFWKDAFLNREFVTDWTDQWTPVEHPREPGVTPWYDGLPRPVTPRDFDHLPDLPMQRGTIAEHTRELARLRTAAYTPPPAIDWYRNEPNRLTRAWWVLVWQRVGTWALNTRDSVWLWLTRWQTAQETVGKHRAPEEPEPVEVEEQPQERPVWDGSTRELDQARALWTAHEVARQELAFSEGLAELEAAR